jgi:hypothetical protein
VAALRIRKLEMQKELAAFEAAQAEAARRSTSSPNPMERKVSRAEALFERAMAASGAGDLGLVPTGDAAKLAEVEALRREDAIAERLAALRGSPAGQ